MARWLAGAGHEVKIANSRGPHTLQELAAETGATAVTAAEAVYGLQVILLSVPLGRMRPLREPWWTFPTRSS